MLVGALFLFLLLFCLSDGTISGRVPLFSELPRTIMGLVGWGTRMLTPPAGLGFLGMAGGLDIGLDIVVIVY